MYLAQTVRSHSTLYVCTTVSLPVLMYMYRVTRNVAEIYKLTLQLLHLRMCKGTYYK